MKNRTRIIIDISMTVLLPLLMAYSLIGEKFHEIAGTAIFVLFIIHHILNRKWYGALFKGKYNARRAFQTALDLVLLVFMILQPVSGILMSKHLYTFLPDLPVSAWARSVHMLLAYWGYTLLSIHAGTHLIAPFRKTYGKNRKLFVTICVILGCISAYGCAAFIRRGFPGYMFCKTAFAFFDFSEPRVFFFMDYIAVMILFMAAGCLIMYGLGRIDAKRKAVKK